MKFQHKLDSFQSKFEETLLKSQFEIQEKAFNKISHEIHDNINQTLTLAKLQLTSSDLTRLDGSSGKILSSINFLSEAIEELRKLSHVLNKDYISSIGLYAGIKKEVKKISEVRELDIHLNIIDEPELTNPDAEIVIFRVFQEIIQNIIKHAQASRVDITIAENEEFLNFEIKDNGIGFNLEEQNLNGMGLKSIIYRVHQLDGKCEINSKPNNGTTVKINIPI